MGRLLTATEGMEAYGPGVPPDVVMTTDCTSGQSDGSEIFVCIVDEMVRLTWEMGMPARYPVAVSCKPLDQPAMA